MHYSAKRIHDFISLVTFFFLRMKLIYAPLVNLENREWNKEALILFLWEKGRVKKESNSSLLMFCCLLFCTLSDAQSEGQQLPRENSSHGDGRGAKGQAKTHQASSGLGLKLAHCHSCPSLMKPWQRCGCRVKK